MKKIFALFSLVIAAMTFTSANAQLLFNEGSDYIILENPLPLQKEGQDEVVEFFSYTCPHCNNLEPWIVKWAKEEKPDTVDFHQIHATGGGWNFPAQVKQVAEKLGLDHEFNQAYFKEIHQNRNRRVAGDKDTAIAFIAEHSGREAAEVEKAWNSLQVKAGLKRSSAMMQRAELTGVPAVVVNGKYLVNLTEYERFFDVINFLLATKSVSK